MFESVEDVAPGVRLHLHWPDPDRPIDLTIGGDGATLHDPWMHQPCPASPSELVGGLPDGRLAAEIDAATRDPATLGEAEVVDAIIVFERMQAWAGARQAALLA
jgi:hypothetical protein